MVTIHAHIIQCNSILLHVAVPFRYKDHCESVTNVQDIVPDFSISHALMMHHMVWDLLGIYDAYYMVRF